jgi:NAD(P)H-hydrate epimerase
MNDLFKGEKVVLASTMALFEQSLIADDPSLAEKFMDKAAGSLYKVVCQKILHSYHFSRVVLLVGKGNNGADAYALGSFLLSHNLEVVAYQLYEDVSYLCAKKGAIFEENGGVRFLVKDGRDLDLNEDDLIIDGLFGTGFKGELPPLIQRVINRCNESNGFVFSIDIPSGIHGDTGIVKQVAIKADMTGYLGALKVGNLFEDGLIHAGILQFVDFGLDIKTLKGEYNLVDPSMIYQMLPKRSLLDNKYSLFCDK